jgi:hypothetical protein
MGDSEKMKRGGERHSMLEEWMDGCREEISVNNKMRDALW